MANLTVAESDLTDFARQRNRITVSSRQNKSRIYIGDVFEHWNELKHVLRVPKWREF